MTIQIKLEDRPESLPTYRKTGLANLLWVETPFTVHTHEGAITIDENSEDWDGGYFVNFPDDGSKPYALSKAFVRDNYELVP